MKLLIDNALSPMVSQALRDSGHDSIHVRELGLQAASDTRVFEQAEQLGRVIVSADTDFGALLALRRKAYPSFILFRQTSGVRPTQIADQLKAIVRQYGAEIEDGCIITVSNERIRVRSLPIEQKLPRRPPLFALSPMARAPLTVRTTLPVKNGKRRNEGNRPIIRLPDEVEWRDLPASTVASVAWLSESPAEGALWRHQQVIR